jgi:hypothetical protein
MTLSVAIMAWVLVISLSWWKGGEFLLHHGAENVGVDVEIVSVKERSGADQQENAPVEG